MKPNKDPQVLEKEKSYTGMSNFVGMYTFAESFIQHILMEHFILQMNRDNTKNYTWLTNNKF
jgi:hypothetical protein